MAWADVEKHSSNTALREIPEQDRRNAIYITRQTFINLQSDSSSAATCLHLRLRHQT